MFPPDLPSSSSSGIHLTESCRPIRARFPVQTRNLGRDKGMCLNTEFYNCIQYKVSDCLNVTTFTQAGFETKYFAGQIIRQIP